MVSPSSLKPQQTGVPSVLIAHEWKPPALIWVTLPIAGGIVV